MLAKDKNKIFLKNTVYTFIIFLELNLFNRAKMTRNELAELIDKHRYLILVNNSFLIFRLSSSLFFLLLFPTLPTAFLIPF